MKRLYLLRHAKSSWKDESLPDRERPLAGRGRRAATAMARHLDAAGIEPQLVLCSQARRTLETLERIRSSLHEAEVRVEPELYGAHATALLTRLRRIPDAVGSAMVIGHNPALQELALDLARLGPAAHDVAAKLPTGALVELELPVDSWAAVRRGRGELVSFVRPADLPGQQDARHSFGVPPRSTVDRGWQRFDAAADCGSIARWLAVRVGARGRMVAADPDGAR